jgi:hypothetical protein
VYRQQAGDIVATVGAFADTRRACTTGCRGLLEVRQESLPTCVVGRLEAVAERSPRSERPLAAAASDRWASRLRLTSATSCLLESSQRRDRDEAEIRRLEPLCSQAKREWHRLVREAQAVMRKKRPRSREFGLGYDEARKANHPPHSHPRNWHAKCSEETRANSS